MTKKKKIIISLAISIVLVSLFTLLGTFAYKKWNTERLKPFSSLSLSEQYVKQNIAFRITIKDGLSQYRPLKENEYTENFLYYMLYHYNKSEGKNLTLEKINKYLSEEYENDGSIRIFTNEKHSEIADYIIWYWSGSNMIDMTSHFEYLNRTFEAEASNYGLENYAMSDLDLDSFKELLKVALELEDPDYEMAPWKLRPNAVPLPQ